MGTAVQRALSVAKTNCSVFRPVRVVQNKSNYLWPAVSICHAGLFSEYVWHILSKRHNSRKELTLYITYFYCEKRLMHLAFCLLREKDIFFLLFGFLNIY